MKEVIQNKINLEKLEVISIPFSAILILWLFSQAFDANGRRHDIKGFGRRLTMQSQL